MVSLTAFYLLQMEHFIRQVDCAGKHSFLKALMDWLKSLKNYNVDMIEKTKNYLVPKGQIWIWPYRDA